MIIDHGGQGVGTGTHIPQHLSSFSSITTLNSSLPVQFLVKWPLCLIGSVDFWTYTAIVTRFIPLIYNHIKPRVKIYHKLCSASSHMAVGQHTVPFFVHTPRMKKNSLCWDILAYPLRPTAISVNSPQIVCATVPSHIRPQGPVRVRDLPLGIPASLPVQMYGP